MRLFFRILLFLIPVSAAAQPAGETFRQYHPAVFSFTGPRAEEAGAVNPFLDYRFEVTFRHEPTGAAFRAPGYFAADGRADETGAASGSVWRVHFTPSLTGRWTYTVSFRRGKDVAVRLDPSAGSPIAPDGAGGAFTVIETDKSGTDFRGKGMLRYVGRRYLRFDNGEYFLKGGADSPETLLAYTDFDGTRINQGKQTLKTYADHVRDWRPGDPSWQGGKGKGLIGALNYLASEGLNAFSFLTLNVGGDGDNVWPWTSPETPDRYDVSKLAQWERVFSHADSLGLFLHFKTQETENDRLLDDGDLGRLRKLYYRELVARFGHHPALNWNLGEENNLWDELDDPAQMRIRAYAAWIDALDPYDHPIVLHSYPEQQIEAYVPLLGERSTLAGISLQTSWDRVHEDTWLWVRASEAAGRPWVVANDEQNPAGVGVTPDGEGNNHATRRHRTLWGHLMAGGAGVETYFGYRFPHNDLNAEDFRSRDQWWDYIRHALHFFRMYLPFTEMRSMDDLASGDRYVFARPGEKYAIYVPDGKDTEVRLAGEGAAYSVEWFNPRSGGSLLPGATVTSAPGHTAIGPPPDGEDWVALIRRR